MRVVLPGLECGSSDNQVHVTRFAGAWDPVATFATSPDTIALELQLIADRTGILLVAWREAAHFPVLSATYPAVTTLSSVQVRTGDTGAFTGSSVTPFDARSPIIAFSVGLDDANKVVLAETEGDVTFVLRGP